MDLNQVMLIGRATKDPELKNTPQGQTVATFNLATSQTWKDQSGQKQEKTEFSNIVAWGKLAEIIGQYVKKGSKLYVQGRLETRDWTGQDNVKRYRTEIILKDMIMLDRPKRENNVSGIIQVDTGEADIKIEEIPF